MFAPKIPKNQPDQSQGQSLEAIAESGTDLEDGSVGKPRRRCESNLAAKAV
jgi:hypothetical protein